MNLPKGWINRQFAHVERDAQSSPTWMRQDRVQSAPSTEPSRNGDQGQTAAEHKPKESKALKAG